MEDGTKSMENSGKSQETSSNPLKKLKKKFNKFKYGGVSFALCSDEVIYLLMFVHIKEFYFYPLFISSS